LRGLSALGLHGRGAILLGRATGVAAEATGFTLASRTVGRLTGSNPHPLFHEFGREWASMAMLLGFMRTAGWGVRQFYGADWVPATAWQRFNLGAQQQVAMYGSLMASTYANQHFGLAPHRSLDQNMVDSLALLVTFNAAGRLYRGMLGSWVGPMERKIELAGRRVEAAVTSRGPRFGDLAWAGAAGAYGGDPLMPARDLSVLSVGRPNGKGSSGGNRTGRGNGRTEAVAQGRISDTFEKPRPLDGTKQLLSEISSARFRFRIMEEHLCYQFPEFSALEVPQVLKKLNGLFFANEIPSGRLLNLTFRDGSPSVDFIKYGRQFVVRAPRVTPVETAKLQPTLQERLSDLRGISQRMQRVSRPVPSSRPPEGQWVLPDRSLIPEILPSLNALPRLLLRSRPTMNKEGMPSLVLRGEERLPEQLNARTRGIAGPVRPNVILELWAPSTQKTYQGRVVGKDFVWAEVQSSLWGRIGRGHSQGRYSVNSPLELVLLLETLARDPARKPDSHTFINWTAEVDPPSARGLVLQLLNRHHLPGSSLTIETPGGGGQWSFTQTNGNWSPRFLGRVAQGTPPNGGTPRAAVNNGEAPTVLRNMEQLREFLRDRVRTSNSDSSSVYLDLGRRLREQELRAVSNHLMVGLRQGQKFLLHDQGARTTYLFQKQGKRMNGRSQAWEAPRGLRDLRVDDMLDLYRALSFIPQLKTPIPRILRVDMNQPWNPEVQGRLFQDHLRQGNGNFPFVEIHIQTAGKVHIMTRDRQGVW